VYLDLTGFMLRCKYIVVFLTEAHTGCLSEELAVSLAASPTFGVGAEPKQSMPAPNPHSRVLAPIISGSFDPTPLPAPRSNA
jgi:hypothetical protein